MGRFLFRNSRAIGKSSAAKSYAGCVNSKHTEARPQAEQSFRQMAFVLEEKAHRLRVFQQAIARAQEIEQKPLEERTARECFFLEKLRLHHHVLQQDEGILCRQASAAAECSLKALDDPAVPMPEWDIIRCGTSPTPMPIMGAAVKRIACSSTVASRPFSPHNSGNKAGVFFKNVAIRGGR